MRLLVNKFLSSILVFCICTFILSCYDNKDEDSDFRRILKESGAEVHKKADAAWNQIGGWGEFENDISYQEIISFYVHYDKHFNLETRTKIIVSILFSISNLQTAEGGYIQNGKPSYVRTSQYLTGLLLVIERDASIYNKIPWLDESIKKSAYWLIANTKGWAGNQTLSALITFSLLKDKYAETQFSEHYDFLRQYLFEDFEDRGDSEGFWPEAPKTWSNRLLTPYLQTQIMFAGYYLELNSDPEFERYFLKLLKFFSNIANFDNLTLDVSSSYSYADGDEHFINLTAPVTLIYVCKYLDLYCEYAKSESTLRQHIQNFWGDAERNNYLTLYTDSYYRMYIMLNFESLIVN
ncbi:MAG: hypothetical protein HWE27_10800 [Gammaproteobacteria bacterium]|nr:hypothetical protein [Gammaproteobacteria bacterium]